MTVACLVDIHVRPCLLVGTLRVAVMLGAGGIRADKREGDGATPPGLLAVRRVLYRADRGRAPACAPPREALAAAVG